MYILLALFPKIINAGKKVKTPTHKYNMMRTIATKIVSTPQNTNYR